MKFFRAIKIAMILFIFPLLAFVFSLRQINELNSNIRIEKFQYESMIAMEALKKAVDADEFICRKINELFEKNSNPYELAKEVEKFSLTYELDLKNLVWNKNGELISGNLERKSIDCDLKDAYQTLKKPSRSEFDLSADPHEENLKRIFGPLFFSRFHRQCFLTKDPCLIRCDSKESSPLVWVRADSRLGLAVFVDPAKIQNHSILRKEVNFINPPTNCYLGVQLQGKVFSASEFATKSMVDLKKHLSENLEAMKKINGLWLYNILLDHDAIGFVVAKEKTLESEELPEWLFVMIALVVIIFLAIAGPGLKVASGSLSSLVSLRKQLFLLFFLANIVPIIILSSICNDYLRQYEDFLKIKFTHESMVYLQQIDESFASEYTFQLRKMTKIVKYLQEKLACTPVSPLLIEDVIKKQSPSPYRLTIVGTQTIEIGSELGVFRNGVLEPASGVLPKHVEAVDTIMNVFDKMGKCYLSMINNEEIPANTMLKVELITDSITQFKPINIFHGFLSADNNFWEWGMGKNSFPVYVKLIKFADKQMFDYLFLYFFMTNDLQKNFLNREFYNLNRNDLGLNLVFIDDSLNFSLPLEARDEPSLKKIAQHLTDFGSIDFATCYLDGEEYLVTGLKCSALSFYNLIGLYPAKELERKKWEKFRLFAGSILFSLLASLAMGLFVSGIYLYPIEELQKGVVAFQRREFKYRLEDLGNDEFGSLSRLFNETLEDFEELQVAEIVQKKLLPDCTNKWQTGCLTISKFSSSSSQLGGDYIDFFGNGENEILVFGDVAGKGVAASLVMAFVKSCILRLNKFYENPGMVLKQINSAFFDSKCGKSRKAMSLQYLVLNGKIGEIKLANAGHCFPILINESGKIKTIDLPSYPLGSSKKGMVSEVCLFLNPNEKLVLYSGGFFINPELSYDLFLDLIKKGSSIDENQFLIEIESYLERRNASDLSDDATIIIIQRNVESKI